MCLALLTGFLVLVSSIQAFAQSSYDSFFNGVTGPSRVMGLGGAYRGYSEGAYAAVYNPAGLSTMDSWWDAAFTFGSFSQSFDTTTGLDVESENRAYVYVGAVFKVEKWRDLGFGIFVSNPYEVRLRGRALSNTNQSRLVDYEFKHIEVSFPFSIRVYDQLYFGLTFNATSSEMNFEVEQGGSVLSEARDALGGSVELGLLYKLSEDLRFGLQYIPKDTLGFAGEEISDVADFTPFREAKTPHRLYLGSYWKAFPRLLFFADLGYIHSIADSILPGSGLSSAALQIESGGSPSVQYFLGAEYWLDPGRWEARVGHYLQPGRAEGEPNRYHATGGLDFYFWYIQMGIAFDFAKDYLNLAFSVSPSWGHRDRRKAAEKL